MTVRLIRLFFLFMSVMCGYYIGALLTNMSIEGGLTGAGFGIVMAATFMFVETRLKQVSLRNLSAAAFGLIFGFFMAWMVTLIARLVPMDEMIYSILQIVFTLIFCYLGMIICLKGKDEFNIIIPYVRFSPQDQKDQLFILDTSVIIDGRIASICETKFLEGRLVVPRFVLQELHQVADSADDAKRASGRRGLDMLNTLKKIEGIDVIIHEESLPDVNGVDAKLIRLARILNAYVVTNDFNLNKIGKLEGARILNINDLANALRPVIFPGEKMSVQIRKDGKERNQGVAFMDDGTMIVVENAKRFINKSVNIVVSSVLQTSAGRMIFANLVEQPTQAQGRPKQQGSGRKQEARGEKQ